MTSTFSIRGSNITIAKNENVTHLPILPGGNYDIRFNQQMGFFYLEKLPNYTLDFKLYDNLESKAHTTGQEALSGTLNTIQQNPRGEGAV